MGGEDEEVHLGNLCVCERAMLGNIDYCVSEKKCVPEGMC